MNSLRPRTLSSRNTSGKRSVGLFLLAFAFISIIGSAFVQAQSEDPSPYCDFSNTYNTSLNYGMGITEIDFDGIEVMDASAQLPLYHNYSAVQERITVVRGETYAMYAKTGEFGYGFRQDIKVWIDYNADGDFDDPGEMVYFGDDNSTLHNFNVTIPANVPSSTVDTRIRVISDYEGYYLVRGSPCPIGLSPNGSPVSGNGYGNCRDFTLSFGSLPDAGAVAVTSPVAPYLPNTNQPVTVVIQNYGDGALNDCEIEWHVDSEAAQTYSWNAATDPLGPIPSGETRAVVVGPVTLDYKIDGLGNYVPYSITAMTKNPNAGSGDDTEPLNDAIPDPQFVTAPAIEIPRTFVFGGADPSWFATGGLSALEVAANYMSAAGILGEGALEFVFNPGTYTGVINILGMSNPTASFILRSASADNKAVLTHDGTSPYLINIVNSVNITVRDLELLVDGYLGNGGIVNVSGSENVDFLNNIFTVENPGSFGYVLNLYESYDVVVGTSEEGNIFYSGGTIIREDNSALARKLSIVNNRFSDFYWGAVSLMGSDDPNMTEHDVVVDNNTFTVSDPAIYSSLKFGVSSYNGTQITNNTFTGLKTYTNQYPVPTAINAIFSAYNPTWSDLTLIDNNTITDCENIHGINTENIAMLEVTNNDVRIKSSAMSNSPNAVGIVLDNCGGLTPTTTAVVKDNKVRITENGGQMMNVYGLAVNESNIKVLYNDIYLLDNGINGAPHGAGYIVGSEGYVANNWFTARGATGVILTSNNGLKFFYNAVNVNAGQQYAMEVIGVISMPVGIEGSISAPPPPVGDVTIMRNLIINEGDGAAALFDVNGSIGSYQNNFWTAGTYIGGTYDYGMVTNIAAQKDGDGVIMNDETILAWEAATESGQVYSGNLVSWAHEVTFEAFDILKPIIIDNDIIYDNELASGWFGFNAGDPIFAILNDEMQLHGWELQERSKFTIGTWNIIPMIEIDLEPMAVVDCWETANHQLSVVAFASGGAQLNYEWFKDGKSLTELYDANMGSENWANRAILYLDDMTPFRGFETGLSYDMQGVYHCEVTAGAAEALITERVLVAVLRNPIISRQPESMQVALGGTIMMDAEAQIYGGIENSINLDEFEVIVQWYDGSVAPPVEIVNDDRISGAKSSMLQIRLLTQEDLDRKYFVRMVGHCGTVVSEIAELTAMATVDFTVQPEDVVACEGDDVELTFEAELTGGEGTEEIMYTLLKDGMPVSGPQAESMFPLTLTQDDEATYTVLAAVVPGDDTETSDPFMVDVLSSATITSTMPAELAVDLADDSGTFTLEVVAEGDGEITYVWEFNDEVVGDAALYSVEAATFTTDDHAGTYRCTVTNECGSDVIEFTVTVVMGGIMMGVDNGTNAVQLSNTPNPVNVETKIEFNAATETSARLVVIDQSGSEVAVLVDGTVNAGYNSVTMNVADYNLASGVYYYTLTINGTTTTNKLIVVK